MPRKYTNLLLDGAEQGSIPWETLARACLDYMSEFEVADMAKTEGLVDEEEEEEEEVDEADRQHNDPDNLQDEFWS